MSGRWGAEALGARGTQATGSRRAGRHGVGAQGRARHGRPGRGLGAGWVRSWASFGALCTWLSFGRWGAGRGARHADTAQVAWARGSGASGRWGAGALGARGTQATGSRRAGRHGVGAQGRAGHSRPGRGLGARWVRRLGQLGQFWCTMHLA